jgi:hypothetical protein
MQNNTVTLYRPTGPEELELVKNSGYTKWPPRLPEQPIFYPVTNEAYARQIAVEWNIKASGVGYVTRFQVAKAFMDRYEVQKVGGAIHLEWWIPAEELEAMNENIVGLIEVIGEYRANEGNHELSCCDRCRGVEFPARRPVVFPCAVRRNLEP